MGLLYRRAARLTAQNGGFRPGQYCSAFADTDAVFGSVGSFFDWRPARGSFVLNPPFAPELILAICRHAAALLDAASAAGEVSLEQFSAV